MLKMKIAEIQVGGRSEVEQGEIRDHIVDALNSAKAAMSEGVLPGGGTALYQASKLFRHSQAKDMHKRIASEILGEALEAPIRQLISNKTGLNPLIIVEQID